VTWIDLDPGEDVHTYMKGLCAPELQQMDLSQPSLLKLKIARDPDSDEHFVLIQLYHVISDHVGLDILVKELMLYQMGQGDDLPAPVPYREFVAHTQHQALHNDAQTYFQNTLGDVDEPTAPFNLVDVQGDGSRIIETRMMVPAEVSEQ